MTVPWKAELKHLACFWHCAGLVFKVNMQKKNRKENNQALKQMEGDFL